MLCFLSSGLPRVAALAAILLPLALFLTTTRASALVIDFEGRPSGEVVGADYLGTGVSFSRSGGGSIGVGSQIPGPLFEGERSAGPTPFIVPGEFRADFSFAATFVSVVLGDFGGDAETLYLEAFDANDTLLDSAAFFIDETFTGGVLLSVSASSIDYVTFGSVSELTDADGSVFFDSFTVVPEPSTSLLLGSALLILGLRGRRMRSAAG